MNIRVVLLLVPFLLTGCSTVSNFSFSSLSPLNWFSSSPTLSDSGLGDISSATPLDEGSLNKTLDGDYRLRKGMGISAGQTVTFFEAMDGTNVKLAFYANEQGKVKRIEVMDNGVKTAVGTKLGTKFSELYEKAFNVCEVGIGDSAGSVACKSPESQRITYIFSGEWMGSSSIMPPDDKLRTWTISKMIWNAK
ncbi:RpoE-regulated lipoprotein [Budvicia diplopodorum]|uniref:RpoE-regulated lipoprotein n=1 Tax=Budvicia diplopodorum TaxID=1119056 RepID=UPI00135B3FAB|nr:RpoE-regulated lipoprotein [Budvicia diplopodorum]